MFLCQRRAPPSVLCSVTCHTSVQSLRLLALLSVASQTQASCPGSLGGAFSQGQRSFAEVGYPEHSSRTPGSAVAPVCTALRHTANPNPKPKARPVPGRELPPGMSRGAELTEPAVVG